MTALAKQVAPAEGREPTANGASAAPRGAATSSVSANTFEHAGVVFRCFVEGDAFVWRDQSGRMAVTAGAIRFPTDAQRENGVRAERLWRAVFDGREIGAQFVTIKAAMDAAVWAKRRGG
ncbi:MAG: hypothetical protein CTY28_14485 [Hyphomicrobium sp.]|nr:MAG: hypothetical protein CTY28_14485 [Hyphomicrobium sp.]